MAYSTTRYSGIPRATTYNLPHLKLATSNHSTGSFSASSPGISNIPRTTTPTTKRASVVNFQRPQPWVPANTVTPPLTPQTSDDNLYMNMAPNGQVTMQQQQQLESQQLQQPQQQQQYLYQQQSPQQVAAAPFAEYWRAFYGYYPAYDAQSSTVTLPLNAGDLVLVHSIHDNGWADGTLLGSGIRGWFPTNYCEPYDPEPIRNLLRALTTFFDIVRSGAEGNVAVFCNQDYMRGLVAGVRFLLEKTACLSREAPMVSACLALSRSRKALLSDLSMLVKIAKTLQSELTATHAQPELEESCIDDMVLRAFKLVMRAVKFHDVWTQALADEDALLAELHNQQQLQGSPLQGGGDAVSYTETSSIGCEVNRRDSATLSGSLQAGALTGANAVARQSVLLTESEQQQQQQLQQQFASGRTSSFSFNSNHNTATVNSLQQSPHQYRRMSSRRTSILYSRPQTSQSQAQFSFSNSRPSSLAASTPVGGVGSNNNNNGAGTNRHSISHRISYASKLDGVSRENLASERLTQAHENLLTSLGAFIGIHVSSRTSQELLSTTQECLDGTERLTQTLRAIWERGYFGSESIDEIEETMFGHISCLVDAVQAIFNALSRADEDGSIMDIDFPTGDRRQLTEAATNCIRAAGESVSKGRYVLEMIGDFEFEMEKAPRQSLFDGTSLASAALSMTTITAEEDAVTATTATSGGRDEERPRDSVVTTSPESRRSLSQRLSSLASPHPNFEPPEAPAVAPLRIDTTRPSLEQSDATERMSNSSWLPPLPRLASPLIGNDSSDVLSSRHSFLKVADGQEIQISPRSDSLRGASIVSGSTLADSKRGSERSSVSMTSTRATSPEPHNDESRTLTAAPAMATEKVEANRLNQQQQQQQLEEEVEYYDEEEEQQQNTEDEELDEKVLEKTYAHELVFNKEGQITGGTLPALVERLTTADSTPDAVFVSTFYLTFRLFATPQEFAQALIERFAYSGESQDVASPVQLRVYNVFKGWLESHWRFDSDESALEQIVVFSTGPLTAVLPNAGKHLFELANRVNNTYPCSSPTAGMVASRLVSSVGKTSVSISTFAAHNAPLPSPSINRSQTNLLKMWRDGKAIPNVIDFEPLELARQFTLKVSSVFCNITPEELLGIEWTKKSGSMAFNVRAMSTLSTDLANLVAECVLNQEDAGKRAKVIKHWIKIAKCCLELANYDSLIAIVCSLNSTTILRLKKTWDAVSAKSKAVLVQLNAAVDCSKNYSQLRGQLAGAAPPCLPFLGMYLTDLTFVDAGNPNSRTTADGTRLINFDKHVKTARIISELQRFQIPYRFQEIAEMQTWIQDSLVRVRSNEASGQAGGQAYYRRSLLLEPRADAVSRIPSAPSPALSQGAWSPTEEKPKSGMKDFQSMLRGVMKREIGGGGNNSNSTGNGTSNGNGQHPHSNESSRRPSVAGQE